MFLEGLLSTVVFILPGFMMYFWIQMMGINPVVKHSVPEFGALAALAWFPVVACTLGIMRLYRGSITDMQELAREAGDLLFLLQFTGISIFISFFLAATYVKWIYPYQLAILNYVRRSIGKTNLSKSPSVWEEVFFQNDITIVGVAKFGNKEPEIYGCIKKVARPFEPKRSMCLTLTEHVTKVIEAHKVPVECIYSDVDAGVNIFIYNLNEFNKADGTYRESEGHGTPSRSTRATY